jgi:hypothetical protein
MGTTQRKITCLLQHPDDADLSADVAAKKDVKRNRTTPET